MTSVMQIKLPLALGHVSLPLDLKAEIILGLDDISQKTGAVATLRGYGSGYIEPDTGQESLEPLHVQVELEDSRLLQVAKEMALALAENIHNCCETLPSTQSVIRTDMQSYTSVSSYTLVSGNETQRNQLQNSQINDVALNYLEVGESKEESPLAAVIQKLQQLVETNSGETLARQDSLSPLQTSTESTNYQLPVLNMTSHLSATFTRQSAEAATSELNFTMMDETGNLSEHTDGVKTIPKRLSGAQRRKVFKAMLQAEGIDFHPIKRSRKKKKKSSVGDLNNCGSEQDNALRKNQESREEEVESLKSSQRSSTSVELVVFKENYPIVKFTEYEGELIRNNLMTKVMLYECGRPPFFTSYLESGAVIVSCEDQATEDWVIATVPSLRPWPGAKLLVDYRKDMVGKGQTPRQSDRDESSKIQDTRGSQIRTKNVSVRTPSEIRGSPTKQRTFRHT